jgi:uncharacterized protein YggU (UPF0235/DUF167 family)
MRILVKAKTCSKKPAVTVVDASHLIVAVKELAVDNKANVAILSAVARHFAVSLGQVRIVSGRSSTRKIIEIEK